MIHIKRTQIPENLKSEAELKKMGLRPITKPVAYTYQQFGPLYYLYDIKDTRAIRKCTENQLKALEKGRLKAVTCVRCNNVYDTRYFLNNQKVCEICIEKEEREKELQRLNEYKLKIKNQCIEWLGNPDKYIILDTETTGLEDTDEVVEICLIDTSGKILFESLIKPTQEIPNGAIRIHGITDKMVEAAPKWNEVWDEIKSIMIDKTLLIFNSGFDISMIMQTCQKYDIKTAQYNIDDSIKAKCLMNIYSNYVESSRWIGLQAACHWEGVEITQDHRAKGDCLMVLELIRKISVAEIR